MMSSKSWLRVDRSLLFHNRNQGSNRIRNNLNNDRCLFHNNSGLLLQGPSFNHKSDKKAWNVNHFNASSVLLRKGSRKDLSCRFPPGRSFSTSDTTSTTTTTNLNATMFSLESNNNDSDHLKVLLRQTEERISLLSSSSSTTFESTSVASRAMETWLDWQQEWINLFYQDFHRGRANSRQHHVDYLEEDPLIVLLLQGMLQASHAVQDVLPQVDPRLSPFYYYYHDHPSSSFNPLFPMSSAGDDEEALRFLADAPNHNQLTTNQLHPIKQNNNHHISLDHDTLCRLVENVMKLSAQSLRAFHQYQHQQKMLQQQSFKKTTNSLRSEKVGFLIRSCREIPQRIQSLYERLRETVSSNVSHDEFLLRCCAPHVLTAWAYGQEYKRGSRAQSFYESLLNQENNYMMQHNRENNENVSNRNPETDNSTRLLKKKKKDFWNVQADRHRLLIRAWRFSSEDTAAGQASAHLKQLYQLALQHGNMKNKESLAGASAAHLTESSSSMPPTLEDYHMVFQACLLDKNQYSSSSSYSHPANRAMSVLQQLTTQSWLRPDVKSFGYVLDTVARHPISSPQELSLFLTQIWHTMIHKWALQPDLRCYCLAIRAWKFVAFQHQQYLTTQENSNTSDAASKEQREEDCRRDIDAAVLQIQDLFQQARKNWVNIAGANYATSDDNDHQEKYNYVETHKGNNDLHHFQNSPSFSVHVYNDVLESLTVWSSSKKIHFAESVLQEMEHAATTAAADQSLTDAGVSTTSNHNNIPIPTPNFRSYCLLVRVYQSAAAAQQMAIEDDDATATNALPSSNGAVARQLVPRAKQVLWRMMDKLPKVNDHASKNDHPSDETYMGKLSPRRYDPKVNGSKHKSRRIAAWQTGEMLRASNADGYPVDVLNAFVDLCVTVGSKNNDDFVKNDDEDENSNNGLVLFREALSAVESVRRRHSVQPNWETYALLLRAASLLPRQSGLRPKIVEQVFQLACQDGMVEEPVLEALMVVTTKDQYKELVLNPANGNSTDASNPPSVPPEWSVQAGGGGRQPPLSVYGERVLQNKVLQESKMRHLRAKRNQALLRGGRWENRLENKMESKSEKPAANQA